MAKISRAAACIAVVVAALSLTGIGASLPIDSAHAADNCATGPGGAAPKGQHWYYRVDQVKHRKCWYLHAAVPLANHAAAESRAAPSEPAEPTPSPSAETVPTTTAANASGETAGTQAAPHVTVLNVKPVTEPTAGATSFSESAIPEQTDEPLTANMPVEVDAKPARPAHVAPPRASPATSHNAAYGALPPARSEVGAPAQTQSARLLFPMLAVALGIVGVLIAVLRKIGGSSGEPRLSEHPDDAWRRYDTADEQADEAVMHQEDAPFLAPYEPYGAVDLDAPEWLDQSSRAPADIPAAPPRGKPWPSERVDLSQKDIELRLRILRHPRQRVVPSGKVR